jgi:hypothetical protein
MKIQSSGRFSGALFLLGWILSGCIPYPPTQVLPEQTVVIALTAQPTATPFATPDRSLELSCTLDSDCVLAYRTDHCCSCGAIYNRQTVEDNRRLRFVNEPEDYRYSKWRTPETICPLIACAPCPMPPFGLVCDANQCRAAQTWQEILSACDNWETDQKNWCFANAAIAAYQAEGADRAATVCASLEGDTGWGIPYSEDCLLQVARTIMSTDPQTSAAFCRAQMNVLLSNCLNETASAIGRNDIPAALALCNEINPQNELDRQHKDYCFHNVAMSVAKVDLVQARQICESMSQGVEQCKLNAEIP